MELIREAQLEIKQLYLADDIPWIVGFSGGKDSNTVLQLVYSVLLSLKPEERHKPVYVIASDTLVENPIVEGYLNETLAALKNGVQAHGLPIVADKVVPELTNTFWVTLLGKGYPSPSRFFRWCTDRLKIDPTTRYIEQHVSESGSAIVLLGARKSESNTRAQVLENYRIPGSRLRRHASMPNAFICAPIADWDAHDVWSFLIAFEAPWAPRLRLNSRLRDLYRDAASGECPLVIDRSTPSCGQSRFGCWTCTVVASDFSMESLIETGRHYTWMKPLLEFRNKLQAYRDDAGKRENWRRSDPDRPTGWLVEAGHVQPPLGDTDSQVTEPGDDVLGPLKLGVRKELLEELLRLQKSTGYPLIQDDEIDLIRQHWTRDYRVGEQAMTEILERVYGPSNRRDQSRASRQLLEQVCSEHGVDILLVDRMTDLERGYLAKLRKRGLYHALDELLEQWAAKEDKAGEC
jgi:DNA sulfur modification protein DndC